MRRQGDYVEKLANNIEDKLNMNKREIQELSRSEFKNLLKNVYFAGKRYTSEYRREPTDKQMDVLDLHYGKYIQRKEKYYYVDKKSKEWKYVEKIRLDYDKNKIGRLRDVKTGRFVKK